MTIDLKNQEAGFTAHRGRLLGLAYRMLGSWADAEDVVQESWLRLSATAEEIRNLEAFLVTITTRLCLDRLKSARANRETYVGPWLPEPILSSQSYLPDAVTTLADDLSFALLLTLETLTPPERAAFLLHDVFDLSFADIAFTLDKSEAACRQLAARARKAVRQPETAQPVSPEAYKNLNTQFFETLKTGDLDGLKELLQEDVVLYTDGGGIKSSALNLIYGADRVARFFIGVNRKFGGPAALIQLSDAFINGRPGILVFMGDELDQTFSIDIDEGRISRIYVVRNPQKLALCDLSAYAKPSRQN